MAQKTLFRVIKYPTIDIAEMNRRKKALEKAIANNSDYYPDNIESCERCGDDLTEFRYSDSDLAVVCNYCAWTRRDRLI